MLIRLPVKPNPEQLPVILSDTYCTTLVRGGAGSGKTTTAAHRIRKIIAGIAAQRRLERDQTPIRGLVLTFNRTLRGYIEQFIDPYRDTRGHPIELEVETFARWAVRMVGRHPVIPDPERRELIKTLWSQAAPLSRLSGDFMVNEVDFVLGRYGRLGLEGYLGATRRGRGSPALSDSRRRMIIDQVIQPYLTVLDSRELIDWNDFPRKVLDVRLREVYDFVVIDETQDFSVQQIRAVLSKMKTRRSITMVIDTGQSIYPRGMYWEETGLPVNGNLVPIGDIHQLRNNYRNTVQIAQFAEPLLTGMRLGDDGTLPDYHNVRNLAEGRTPELVTGLFGLQAAWAANRIANSVDLRNETVGVLTMWGDTRGEIARALNGRGIPWVSLKAETDWPDGDENVGVSTLHSAKGLEFDHVFILGFDREFLDQYGNDPEDSDYLRQRRLLAMAITRARKTVAIGYRTQYRSTILDLLNPNTYRTVDLQGRRTA